MKNIDPASRLRAWFNNLPIPDPVNRRMAALLQVMLVGFMAIIVISSILNIVVLQSGISWQIILIRSVIFILIIGLPLMLLRRGHFRSSVLIIIGVFFLLESFAVLSVNLREVAETLSFFYAGNHTSRAAVG